MMTVCVCVCRLNVVFSILLGPKSNTQRPTRPTPTPSPSVQSTEVCCFRRRRENSRTGYMPWTLSLLAHSSQRLITSQLSSKKKNSVS
ncbi:hypothetical protein GBAR_LOCUS30459 [Geodia barretti]|uniref:Secreted protein n=1 Tax=Geodia barretti TaxID=519541 RepID=A0AA35XEJ6_GEOBA|nr:hypothetical protein GBAR_LOCUS30459 [Geodia barretti]